MEKTLRFSAIVYNHDIFLFLLEGKVLHKLKVITDWNSSQWYIKTIERTNVQISTNFDTNYGIRRIAVSNSISKDESKMQETSTSSETTSHTEDYSDYEIFIFQKETPHNVNLIADTSEGNI